MSPGNMGFAVFRTGGGGGAAAGLLETGQTTCYQVFDDGDYEEGIAKAYTVQAAGAYAGNTNIEVAHYASNQITFTAIGNIVADGAGGMVTFLAGDTVVIKGSALNDGVYTVNVGGVAGQFTTIEAIINEGPGVYVSFYKRTAHSNNAVDDDSTGLMWSRYSSNAEKVGAASTGLLRWTGTIYVLHNAANTVSVIMPGNIFRVIGGAGEINRYHIGDILRVTGFANAVNLLYGYYVLSVAVNGADLDIVVDPGDNTLIAEGAVGDVIYLVARSIFNYAAGARLASLGGYTDWREPNEKELQSIKNMEAPSGVPNAAAFPGWSAAVQHWTSTSRPDATGNAMYVTFARGFLEQGGKGTAYLATLVRG